MAINFNWGRPNLNKGHDLVFFIPLLLLYGTIGMIFLGLATLGTSYRMSISQIIDARVTEIIPLCHFALPRVNPNKSVRGQHVLPCSDKAAAAKLYDHGLILFRQTEKKLLLVLQESPKVDTSIIVKNTEVASLQVGDKLLVRVPVLRNSETVELASATPLSQKFLNALKLASIVYAGIWVIFLFSYRRIRQTLAGDQDNSGR